MIRSPDVPVYRERITAGSSVIIQIMSTGRKPVPGTLEALATRWLASKQLARRSAASDAARRGDLAGIAVIMAATADFPEDFELRGFERQLSPARLPVALIRVRPCRQDR